MARGNARPRQMRRPAVAALVALLIVPAFGVVSDAAPRRSDLRVARERLMELEREFQLTSERYNLVNERLGRIQQDIGAAELRVDGLRRRMQIRESEAVALAVHLYKSGSAAEAVNAVLTADSLADIETRVAYLSASQEFQRDVFDRMAADRSELATEIARLEDAQLQARAAQDELAALTEEIEAKVAAQKGEIADLIARIERAEARQRARADARAAAARDTFGPVPVARASNPDAQAAVDAALSQLGKPYRWGAEGPDMYDCSGLTLWAWAHAGVTLPHNSGMQYAATARVRRDDWEPGDLLFFGSPIHHVGMYIGHGKMVEAPYTGAHVRISGAVRSDYVGAGRPGL